MPAKLTQSTRLATLSTPLEANALVLRGLHASEQLGRLSAFELEVDSERGDIEADDLLGQAITVEVTVKNGAMRYFHGFVNHFSHSPRAGRRHYRYHLTAVPWLWFLTRESDCRIFQNMSIPDVLRAVFGKPAYGMGAFKFKLIHDYPPWEYCVQYRETDFNFVSRLMEQEGIYYYFEHSEDEHTLVLADAPSAHEPFPDYADVKLADRAGTHGFEDEVLREWKVDRRHHSGVYAHTDYDFTQPRVSLATQDYQPGTFANATGEIFDYPGEYSRYSEGEKWARVRMDEIRLEGALYHTSGNVMGLATGHKFALTGPKGFRDAGSYVAIATSISLRTGVYETGGGDGDTEETFHVSATLIPADTPFRPARHTPKPIVQGIQTAVVTGPKGEEIHTDKYGRIKVQFHWDREGKADENTTCFIRVGQIWAGKQWGAMFIPRIGQEVIVGFLEGDPDQPLIVGSVYNGEQMPFYPLPAHKTKSTIKSNSSKGGQGFNELRFEDKKGGEQVFIHSEKRLDVRAKGDVYETNGGNRDINIGAKSDKYPGGHLSVTVGADANIHVNGGLFERVEKKLNQGVVGDVVAGYDANQSTIVKAKVELNAKEVTIEGLTKITLKVGSSFIVLDLSGITIKAPQVKINSGGSAKGTGDPEIEDPLDAETADTGEPGFLERPRPAGAKGGGSGRKKRTLKSQHGPDVTYNPATQTYQVGKAIKIDGANQEFAAATLSDIAMIGQTPKGQALLKDIDDSGRTLEIHERPPNPADPYNAETRPKNPNDALAPDLGGTGNGSDSSVTYDPSAWPPPKNLSPTQTPSDVTLFHEMTHADHHMHGQRRTPQTRTDNFDNQEEFNTINDENEYRGERNPPVGQLTNGHHEL